MRVVSISFKDKVKIQYDNSVKTTKPGQNLELIELGHLDSYGRDHLCGVVSNQVVNIVALKQGIEKLDQMGVADRLDWFKEHYPAASVVKIDSGKIFNKLEKNQTEPTDKSVVVIGSFELKWSQ